MDDSDLTRVEILFHAALDLPAAERSSYINEACEGDRRLAAEVSSLLSTFENSNGFMDKPALNFGLNVLHNSVKETFLGKTLGVYRIVSQLGKGGMGEVYLAEDTSLNRKVALKFLSPEFVADNWAKRQLVKEAQAAAMLDHPNICPVYGIEEEGEHTFIVMQFVEGQTLCDLIRHQVIADKQKISIARQLAGALAEAHAHGIIHRDIKPRNIMVTHSGSIKVLDFGLAKSVLPKALDRLDDSISKSVQGGLVPGTIRYMSPEQLCNDRLDYRSDIFSAGTVLYEIVSGTNPFERKTGPEVISAILSSTPKPLKQNGARSNGLVPIIERCLVKNRDERFQSANELLIELDKLEQGIAPFPGRTFLRSKTTGFLALFLLLVVGAIVFYSLSPAKESHSIAIGRIVCEGIPDDSCPAATIQQQLLNQLSRRSDLIIKTANEPPSPEDQNSASVEAILSGKIIKRGEAMILKTRLTRANDGTTLFENQHLVPSLTIPFIEELSIRLVFYPNEPPTYEDTALYVTLAALQKRNPDAVELYHRALYYWNKRDKENIAKAIEMFELALDKDPRYALAWAGLANCYAVMPTTAYGPFKTSDVMAKARAAANNALTIDQTLAEAHTSLGIVQMRYDWDWKAAEESFKRAIDLQPDSPSARFWYSNLLGTLGRFEESIVESEKAKQLDVLSPLFAMNVGRAYYRARDFDKTISYLETVLSEKPGNTSAAYVLALAYLQKQMYSRAIEILEKLSTKNRPLAIGPLGYSYARAGRKDEAYSILQEMEEIAKTEHLPAQERAIVYIGLGDNNAAFYWLEKSYEERFGSIISLTTDPIFDSLRSDRRFAALARKINLTS